MKKLTILVIVSIFIIGATGCGGESLDINTEDGTASWNYPLGTIYNAGTTQFSPEPPFGVVWEKNLPNTTNFSPVAASSIVIISDDRGNVYCLSQKTGDVVWSRNLGNTGFQPIIGINAVFVGSDTNEMVALDINGGKTKWKAKLAGDVVGWGLVDAGKLWFTTTHDLYCLEETKGGEIFHKNFGDITFTHAPSLQKYLYLVAGNQLIAFNDRDYEQVWNLYFENELIGPVACQRSNIYAVDGRLFKVDDKNGDVVDSYTYNAPTPGGEIIEGDDDYKADIISTASIFANVICTTTEHGNVIALTDSNTGMNFLWSLGVTFPTTAPVLVGNDYVYFGATDGRFYLGKTADGRWVWHNRFGEREDMKVHNFVASSAVLVDRIFVVSQGGMIKRLNVGGRPMTQAEMSE